MTLRVLLICSIGLHDFMKHYSQISDNGLKVKVRVVNR
jgi:hypothetical protein